MAKSKKEIDKELMYKKLMPSGPRTAKTSTEEPAQAKAAPTSEMPPLPEAPALRRTMEPRKLSVPAMDNQQATVVNTMENIVLDKLESVLGRFQCCRCDRCKKDIVALSLNKLPPKYRVITEGQPIPDIDAQTNAQVVTAMIQAVIQVRAKPRH